MRKTSLRKHPKNTCFAEYHCKLVQAFLSGDSSVELVNALYAALQDELGSKHYDNITAATMKDGSYLVAVANTDYVKPAHDVDQLVELLVQAARVGYVREPGPAVL